MKIYTKTFFTTIANFFVSTIATTIRSPIPTTPTYKIVIGNHPHPSVTFNSSGACNISSGHGVINSELSKKVNMTCASESKIKKGANQMRAKNHHRVCPITITPIPIVFK